MLVTKEVSVINCLFDTSYRLIIVLKRPQSVIDLLPNFTIMCE